MLFQNWQIKLFCFALVIASMATSQAQHREFAPVPPSLEIEVLDPGVDSLGNPAVQLQANGEVEIPPVVLVHRYYYSGDRSFQGPLLPGGPSILVVNHPKTGERIYVPAQMMPGAPRVTYTKRGITYQYEKHAVMLQFGIKGDPCIKYRSGLSFQQKIGNVLHVEEVTGHLQNAKEKSQRLGERLKTTGVGLTAEAVAASKVVTLPVTNILQSMPLGKQLFGGDTESYLAEKAAVYQQEKANKHAEKRAAIDERSIPTNR
ncbi:MAG: hypothetical protein ABL888_04715 [Pirellulaceae bacterium]